MSRRIATTIVTVLLCGLTSLGQTPTPEYKTEVLERPPGNATEIVQVLAKPNDYTVRQAVPTGKGIKRVVPEIVLLNGWIYVTGDRPSVVVDNVLIAQAEGSKLIVKRTGEHRWLVVLVESAENKYAQVHSNTGATAEEDAPLPVGHYVEVATTAGPVQMVQAMSYANNNEVKAIIAEVNAKRLEYKVP